MAGYGNLHDNADVLYNAISISENQSRSVPDSIAKRTMNNEEDGMILESVYLVSLYYRLLLQLSHLQRCTSSQEHSGSQRQWRSWDEDSDHTRQHNNLSASC